MSSYTVKFYRDSLTALLAFASLQKQKLWINYPLLQTIFHSMSESSCCIWTVTQNPLYPCFCWWNCGIFTLHRLSGNVQKSSRSGSLPAAYLQLYMCPCICNHFQRNYEKQAANSSHCLTLNQLRTHRTSDPHRPNWLPHFALLPCWHMFICEHRKLPV